MWSVTQQVSQKYVKVHFLVYIEVGERGGYLESGVHKRIVHGTVDRNQGKKMKTVELGLNKHMK